MPPLSPELLLSVFENLTDSDLYACGLVCRLWKYASRPVAFRVLQVNLGSNERGSSRFLELYGNPMETFSDAGIRTLVISGRYQTWELGRLKNEPESPICMEELWNWHSSDGARTLSSMLSGITRLHLHHVHWHTSTGFPSEVLSSIKELELYYTAFDTYRGLEDLLRSCSNLKSIEITGCRGPEEAQDKFVAQRGVPDSECGEDFYP
ncbi:hypothetical protein L218DRAFT_942581 [Marasmius fiardii PR-910]|nr:hypothetical protein L218DRAFT_942581 [Marasmius fiardii PR-910]